MKVKEKWNACGSVKYPEAVALICHSVQLISSQIICDFQIVFICEQLTVKTTLKRQQTGFD